MEKAKQNKYRTIKIKSGTADVFKKKTKRDDRKIIVITDRLLRQGLKFEESGLKL